MDGQTDNIRQRADERLAVRPKDQIWRILIHRITFVNEIFTTTKNKIDLIF